MQIINQYYNGDCLEILPNVPDNSIDLIITDPPNLVLAKHYSTRTYFERSFGDLGLIEYFYKNVFEHIKRVLKDTGFFYIFCNETSYPFFWYYSYPFTKKVRLLTWNKIVSINGYHWRHQTEFILFGLMPNCPKVKTGDGDVIDCRAVKVNERKHPAEKPEELISKLILKSSNDGQLVADFFAGSGIVLKVSKNLNRNFFGIEYDKIYYEKSKKEIDFLNEKMDNNITNFL